MGWSRLWRRDDYMLGKYHDINFLSISARLSLHPISVSQSFTAPIFLLQLFFRKKTQAKIGGEGKRQRRETTAHIKIIKKGGEGEGG
jgi:Na+/H+ antiporter NhaD/arsenite permease-like protein